MAAYNRNFALDLRDMELIETALRSEAASLSGEDGVAISLDARRKLSAINDLLGRLHNQKVFYRPKQGYIGG